MRIKVADFTARSICEALEEYGMKGNCEYRDGENSGIFKFQEGAYKFICHPEKNEIELTELSIGIDDFVDKS